MKKILLASALLIGIIFASGTYIFLRIYQVSRTQESGAAQVILVLGAAQYDGNPSPVLRARLDRAKELFDEKRAPRIISTGGNKSSEEATEGSVGKKYLIMLGVPAEKIIAEENSLTTKQNIMRAAEIMENENITDVIIVSDPFHMYRAKLIAEDLGLNVILAPTATSPISKNERLEVKYMLREMLLVIAHIFFDA